MALLNPEKLKFFKLQKKLNNQDIVQITNISKSTIDKIFSGTNRNPSISTITKITDILGCTVDDVLDTDVAISSYYKDKEANSIAKKIYETQALKEIFDHLKQFNPDDINLIKSITTRIAE